MKRREYWRTPENHFEMLSLLNGAVVLSLNNEA